MIDVAGTSKTAFVVTQVSLPVIAFAVAFVCFILYRGWMRWYSKMKWEAMHSATPWMAALWVVAVLGLGVTMRILGCNTMADGGFRNDDYTYGGAFTFFYILAAVQSVHDILIPIFFFMWEYERTAATFLVLEIIVSIIMTIASFVNEAPIVGVLGIVQSVILIVLFVVMTLVVEEITKLREKDLRRKVDNQVFKYWDDDDF